jgi:hypothetical protein
MNGSLVGRRWSGLFPCCQWVLLAAASLLLGGTFPRPACSATLQDLLDGGFIGIGNQLGFFDWQVLSLDSTGSLPDLSQIEVNALTSDPANPGLQFVAGGQLSVSGINAIDLVLKFGVQTLGASNTLTSHSLSLTGIIEP